MDTQTLDTRDALRAALASGAAADPAASSALALATLRAAPAHELAEALGELSVTELGLVFARFGDEALAELIAELDPFDAARLLGQPALRGVPPGRPARSGLCPALLGLRRDGGVRADADGPGAGGRRAVGGPGGAPGRHAARRPGHMRAAAQEGCGPARTPLARRLAAGRRDPGRARRCGPRTAPPHGPPRAAVAI